MAKVIFIHADGRRSEIDAANGESIMRTAVSNGIDEIVGECGGALACATCHVYVSPQFLDRLPPMSDDENEMLDFSEDQRKPGSRLSCQIDMNPELDGIEVEVAKPKD